ncbi:MAG: LPS assembly lipoprotein LptE [Verrucomicrobiales bacterium]
MQFARVSARLGVLLLCAATIMVCGCAGYHLGPIKPERLAHVQTIAVPTFENMTLEPRSSVLVTNEVIARLQKDGTYPITSKNKADAVLKGTIRDLVRRQLRGSRTNVLRTREMEVQILIDYTLEDARTHVVLAEGRARGSSHLYLDPNFQLSERQAISHAAAHAARDLVTRLTEGLPGQNAIMGGSLRDQTDSRRDRAF